MNTAVMRWPVISVKITATFIREIIGAEEISLINNALLCVI